MADASGAAPLLVEIGTEEMPPRALRTLSEAFARELCAGLEAERLASGAATPYATPRRLAVHIEGVARAQPGRVLERRGPRLEIAFDAEGRPTRAALGFARSCGVGVEALRPLETDRGAWLAWQDTRPGEDAAALIPCIVTGALERLPLPRRMRWSDREMEFIRPVHWVVLLFGEDAIETEILGVRSGRATRGHRSHHPDPIALRSPADYAGTLPGTGRVMVDFDARIERIRAQVDAAAAAVGGRPEADEALLEEVAALVEWPVALLGHFDPEFLSLPDAVLRTTMKSHQRYFPVRDAKQRLLAHFVTVANIESRNPDAVREGNERVIRPRLRDAEFFFRQDLKRPLSELRDALRGIVFQEGLGTLYEKSERISLLAGRIAKEMGEGEESVRLAHRAGSLSKCDLVTEMVGEFPELQGVMGAEYARRGGEPEALAAALGELYRPGFAGDALPATAIGQALALADRLDTLVGIFGIGQAPSGDRDPFGLRRAALGILRILIERALDLDLEDLLAAAVRNYGPGVASRDPAARAGEFLGERMRTYFAGRGVPAPVFAAVHARRPARPLDFATRIHAVEAFRRRPEAESLSAANKRIGNILRRAGDPAPAQVDEALLAGGAEHDLHARFTALRPQVEAHLRAGDYGAAMRLLATLREDIDAFFDTVLVMAEDEAVRANRLALLARIRALFLETADISLLQDG